MSSFPPTARSAATAALAQAATDYPDLPFIKPRTAGLSAADAPLAVAIHRTTLERWITLEYVLDRYSKQSMSRLEPAMRAVLLAGAAQLLFMPGLPSYAVVDESVSLARRMVRPGAGGMANAVLRKVAGLVADHDADESWQPAADRLPWGRGSLRLTAPILPEPARVEHYLSVATSHPRRLVRRWLETFGEERTRELCLHDLETPPTIVAVEESAKFKVQSAKSPGPSPLEDSRLRTGVENPDPSPNHQIAKSPDPETQDWIPHEQPGFIVWQGSHEKLVAFLAQDVHRRVQDPASAAAVRACRTLEPTTILDFCAGLGTKTRQLALDHPDATVFASDPAPARQEALREVAQQLPNVTVVSPEEARQLTVDLLVLDVPCSNTGVLARRPEARYRLDHRAMASLVELQRRIIAEALPTVRPGGYVLYSTCSIDAMENGKQVGRLMRDAGGTLLHEAQLFPEGRGPTYHDGSYHALIQLARRT